MSQRNETSRQVTIARTAKSINIVYFNDDRRARAFIVPIARLKFVGAMITLSFLLNIASLVYLKRDDLSSLSNRAVSGMKVPFKARLSKADSRGQSK